MASPFRKDYNSQPAEAAAFNTPRPIIAAASRMRLDDKSEADQFKMRQNSQTYVWQSAGWEYYDAIGEIKYAFNLVASVVSRIRLYAATIEDPAESPVPIRSAQSMDPDLADAAERALARLDSAYGGQAGLLRDAALNLSVAGECYLVQVPARPGSGVPESWDIRSVDEFHVDNNGQYVITPRRELTGSGMANKPGAIVLPQTAFVGRIWRAHPRFSEEPDSSLRGILDLCDELLLLNRTFRATHRSRLNAGAIYIPDGIGEAAAPDPNLYADEDDPQPTPEELADAFEEELLAAMSAPIEDESAASAVVPLIIRGPAELGKMIQQFKFDRNFEEQMNARYDRVLERILQGLDVPKDIITGLANVKYSNAIQIDEALYKAHIEPMLLLIADAFTVIFLRPYLKSQGWSEADVNRVVVWYDPSSVATRNDRAADADIGYTNKTISGDTWRRAHGFSDADAPTPNELILRLLAEKGTFTPELSESLLAVVAPDIFDAARAAQQANSVAPIPGEAENILNGGTGAPAAPGAEQAAPGLAEPGVGGAPAAPAGPGDLEAPVEDVAPGEDAPPFPLAEPEEDEVE